MLSLIVAIGKNHEIGRKNQLLCHLPEDLKHFKQLTLSHPVLMGENTYLSLPKRPLPGRRNIVLTLDKGKTYEGCEMAYSIEEALRLCPPEEETFVMGGASVYRQLLPLCDRLYITRMLAEFPDADVFLPPIGPEWELVSEEPHPADERHCCAYVFQVYTKKSDR